MIELSIDFTLCLRWYFCQSTLSKVASLLTNLDSDFAIGNLTFLSIEDKTNLRLHSERYTAALGLFRLACISIWFRDFCSI